jgi:MarR family transcriptional regulator, lower aerobic nicotinate degradation pathway regulator
MEVAGPENLTTFDVAVLASLRDAPGTDQRRLAQRVGINVPKVQRIVSRLERRGLIERSSADSQRSPALSLTPSGLELQKSLRTRLIAAQDRVMTHLSNAERETLKELLARVIRSNDVRAEAAES